MKQVQRIMCSAFIDQITWKVPREKGEVFFYIFTTNYNVLTSKYQQNEYFLLKFGYSEKATKFEKIFHLKFDAT